METEESQVVRNGGRDQARVRNDRNIDTDPVTFLT